MNILIPDSWLREYLKTKATPKHIMEYVSLCGPSVERIRMVGKETVYDVEVTSNRPDVMSISGFAREAAAILPRFGNSARFINDPYALLKEKHAAYRGEKKLTITTDSTLNPRFTAIVLDNVRNQDSPPWLKNRLTLTGIRPINAVVDVTNYLMRSFGQPAHVFDFDRIGTRRDVATMILRASYRGERMTTLDGNTHTLPGDDIVIEDGSGRLIDLCGIMGANNSSVTEQSKTIILFMQTYDPVRIRRTSMSIGLRTEAAGLFEKGVDSELVYPTIITGIDLLAQLTGATVASQLYDLYTRKGRPHRVSVSKEKITSYLNHTQSPSELGRILLPLGFSVTANKDAIVVAVPSNRGDVTIDVDVIEEIARIYGYHTIGSKLPEGNLIPAIQDRLLTFEEDIKLRLRDWGLTETYTYSMISKELMDIFGLNVNRAITIENPLSVEWVYLRPSLLPSILSVLRQNLTIHGDFKIFELSMVYRFRPNDLPKEESMLAIAFTGERYFEAKGVVEAIFDLLGIPFPSRVPAKGPSAVTVPFHKTRSLSLSPFGMLGEIDPAILTKLGIGKPVTVIELDVGTLMSHAKPKNSYIPIPKHPPSFEDLAFILPAESYVGPLTEALKHAHPVVSDVRLLDSYGNFRTFHITYQHPRRNLTRNETLAIRKKLIAVAESFGAILKP